MKIGNIVVGQSGGPTSAINASLAGVFQAKKIWVLKKFMACGMGLKAY